MPDKTWKILPKVSDDLKTQLLHNRGLKTEKEKNEFFNPTLENFEKDLQLPGILTALKRIQKAIDGGEQIIVYGDYDVDGVCASAILYKGLTSLGAKVLPYIPHREKEGYGLSKIGLEFARDLGATLVITVDNGIVALDQARYAKEIGLDLIITDHHIPLEEKPEAVAIVHSLKMCGAGVAWCLIREVVAKDLAKDLLQFVAIATVADLIPLKGIARFFVKEGIKELNKTKNLGLKNLVQDCSLEFGNLGTYEIGHMISPRLNAIGRLEHAIDALRLLCTKDPLKARKLSRLLCESNEQRQQLTFSAIEEAKELIGKNKSKKIHVISSEKWISGIIGLVAGRITEEYARPTIALSIGEVQAKGSARSINGINIVEVIRKCSDLLVDVGGHSGAAGFSILNENIEKFREKLEGLMDNEVELVEQVLEIEAEVEAKRLTKTLVKELEEFAPFGFGNPNPIFTTKAMKVSDIRTVGNGKHLKFKASSSVIPSASEGAILSEAKKSLLIDCIAFGKGDLKDILQNGQLINLAYQLEINRYNGREILQLKVKDIQLS